MTLRNAFDTMATETTLSTLVDRTPPSGALTDTQLRASPLPLPTGAATEATLNALNTKTATAIVDMPGQDTLALPVRAAPQKYTDISFSQVGSGLVSPELTLIRTGAGQTVNQSGGNLVITAGTTANAETLIRSVDHFNGALTFKQITTLSQRIVNQNFFVELADVIGDGLAYAIVNTTTVDVTMTAHGFTALNVGQRIDLGALSSVGVPMAGVIASIPDVNTIRFTVAGWPASGSGTLSLTGWNKVELLYTGTSPTIVAFNTRRRGWENVSFSPSVVATSSGHMLSLNVDNGVVSLAHKTLAAGQALANVSSWDANIPLPSEDMYIQIKCRNGATAPASNTTWTVGMSRVEDYTPAQVNITSVRQQSIGNALPVGVVGTVPVSGTVAISSISGTVVCWTVIPTNSADVPSAAITTTTTTAAFSPTFGTSYEIVIPVTVVSGTNQTLDVSVEESDDSGTNWFRVYGFPRITDTGIYRSPKLSLTGNRVRYVQTIGGTTPSFTRAINRLQSADSQPSIRQLFDRSMASTQALDAVTSNINTQNCRSASLTIVAVGITTTAPALQLEGTDDGANWYAVGAPLTAVANSTVRLVVPDTNSQALRARVSTAGSGATLTHVIIKGF